MSSIKRSSTTPSPTTCATTRSSSTTADPRTGIPPEHLLYTFSHCVRATVTSSLHPDTWAESLDDRLINYDTGADLDGYVWGVKWQDVYPGIHLVTPSHEATSWEASLGIRFREVTIAANAHTINLIFSDLSVRTVHPGHTPFTVPDTGPDWKIPLP